MLFSVGVVGSSLLHRTIQYFVFLDLSCSESRRPAGSSGSGCFCTIFTCPFSDTSVRAEKDHKLSSRSQELFHLCSFIVQGAQKVSSCIGSRLKTGQVEWSAKVFILEAGRSVDQARDGIRLGTHNKENYVFLIDSETLEALFDVIGVSMIYSQPSGVKIA